MKKWVFVLFILLMLNVSASYNYANNSLKTTYSYNELIEGKVNMSLENVNADVLITSNFNGAISVLNLLRKNGFRDNIDYNCSFSGCVNGYSIDQEITSLSLNSNEIMNIGFIVNGQDIQIQSVNISIISNAPNLCYSQISLDIGKNKTYLIQNNNDNGIVCDLSYGGCFNSSLNSGDYVDAEIQSAAYCEKITLPSAPRYQIGAKIIDSTSGSGNITMELYSNDWDLLGSCKLPKQSTSVQELGCLVNYSSAQGKDYFVCVMSNGGNYKIRSEQKQNVCGTDDLGSSGFNRDYEIYAKTLQYGSVDMLINGDQLYDDETLIEYIGSYLEDKDCSEGCAIPIGLSGVNQDIQISGRIKYLSGSTLLETNKVFSVKEEKSKVNSKYLNFDLKYANFSIPYGSSERNFRLYGPDLILSQGINISSISIEIDPKFAYIGVDTLFRVTSSSNISRVEWDFGDNVKQTTTDIKVYHKYLKQGDYKLNVKAIRKDNSSVEKEAIIVVGDPKESAKKIMDKYDKRISNISKQINSYPAWIKDQINKKVNVNELNISLDKLKKDYNFATKDDQYIEIIGKLIALDVPYSVSSVDSGTAPFAIGFGDIDTGAIEQLSGKDAQNKEELQSMIRAWDEDNYDGKIEFSSIAIFADSGKTNILNKFKVDSNPKTDSTDYLIINYPLEKLIFSSNYGEKSIAGATYLDAQANQVVEFAILSENRISASSLGMYISPSIDKLGNFGTIGKYDSNNPRLKYLWIYILIIIIVFFIVYILIQEWYKKKYELFLFKNKDDLYNLISFIINGRKEGLKDSEIGSKLRGKGWKQEQISYAINKLDGKRTGMYEIPIFRSIEQNKIKQEMTKRQSPNVGQKFIKRTNL
jgi:hypothetical protein